jgi:hypothetical protein
MSASDKIEDARSSMPTDSKAKSMRRFTPPHVGGCRGGNDEDGRLGAVQYSQLDSHDLKKMINIYLR